MNENPYSVGEQPTFNDTRHQGPDLDGDVRGMQIIAVALMAGVLLFFGIVLVTTQGNVFGTQRPELITIIAAGFGILAIVNHLIIPAIIAGAHLKQISAAGFSELGDAAKTELICGVYRIQLIIALALLEGAAFFNLIALMIEHSAVALSAVILLLGLMTLRFPTRDKVSFWVQDKLRELQM
jgi:hypothetical protein